MGVKIYCAADFINITYMIIFGFQKISPSYPNVCMLAGWKQSNKKEWNMSWVGLRDSSLGIS